MALTMVITELKAHFGLVTKPTKPQYYIVYREYTLQNYS